MCKYQSIIEQVDEIAKKRGYRYRVHHKNICLLLYRKGDAQISVYYSKMTVGVVKLEENIKNRQQYYRNVYSFGSLDRLFKNPPIEGKKQSFLQKLLSFFRWQK